MPGRRQRGAALLLLLAVLALGGAMMLMQAFGGANMESRRRAQTQASLYLAREALLGYAMAHGHLPCPALSATDGRSAAACPGTAAANGFLPWVTLGIEGTDAWGKRLQYSVAAALAAAPIVHERAVADKTVSHRDPQGALRYRIGGDTCSVAQQCAAAVLLSTGRNNFGTSAAGVAQANGADGNEDEQANALGPQRYIERTPDANPGNPGGSYDDLVAWVPLQLLYRRLASAGQIKVNP